jgi:8-oxo-dGTP pyrophosphatase MutT (NUDIX family)
MSKSSKKSKVKGAKGSKTSKTHLSIVTKNSYDMYRGELLGGISKDVCSGVDVLATQASFGGIMIHLLTNKAVKSFNNKEIHNMIKELQSNAKKLKGDKGFGVFIAIPDKFYDGTICKILEKHGYSRHAWTSLGTWNNKSTRRSKKSSSFVSSPAMYKDCNEMIFKKWIGDGTSKIPPFSTSISGASIIPITKNGKRVVFVKCRGIWGAPGGTVELGETAIEAACREMKEETGMVPLVPVKRTNHTSLSSTSSSYYSTSDSGTSESNTSEYITSDSDTSKSTPTPTPIFYYVGGYHQAMSRHDRGDYFSTFVTHVPNNPRVTRQKNEIEEIKIFNIKKLLKKYNELSDDEKSTFNITICGKSFYGTVLMSLNTYSSGKYFEVTKVRTRRAKPMLVFS